jgi:Leucine-rich repeat (LRR) protein
LDDDSIQLQALTDFYTGSDGDNRTVNTNWLDTGVSYCDRYGITCDGSNNITTIDLQSNSLSGTANLSGLSYLQTLSLNNNNISSINLVGLSSLMTLWIQSNLLNTLPESNSGLYLNPG